MTDISLGFSPCPNDTFIFYGLVHNKIDTFELRFNETIRDVEELNQIASKGKVDITKVSIHAFGYLRDKYKLIRSGGALGRGCGPLLVARKKCTTEDLKGKRIAVPGRLTTALLLLKLLDPILGENIEVMPFNEIMNSVKNSETDAGLMIHESRFTYPDYGLKEVIDLGAWWEGETGMPIPLGGIIAKKGLGEGIINKVDGMIKESIKYAYNHRNDTLAYVRNLAQELDDVVIEGHINLYVNNFTLDMGDEGVKAIDILFEKAREKGLF